MVREADYRSGGGVTLSSIALLQERFRQLEKMKEMRQEKELMMKMLSESERLCTTSPPMIHYEPPPSKPWLGSELFFIPPSKPHCQLSLSLQPDLQIRHDISPQVEWSPSPNLGKSWLIADATSSICSLPINKLRTFDHSDVDTSLHL